MRQHLVIHRVDERELLAQRRRAFAPAGFEISRDLAGKPRTALRGAADHHSIGAGNMKRGHDIVEGANVAIDDHGNRDRLLDRAHGGPVGAAVIKLATRAAMHGDHLDAGLLRATRQLGRVQA